MRDRSFRPRQSVVREARLRLAVAVLCAAALVPRAAAGEDPVAAPPPAADLPPAQEPALAVRPPRDAAWVVSAGTGTGGLVEIADVLVSGIGGLAGLRSERSGRIHVHARAERELGRWFSAGLAYTFLGWSREDFGGAAEPVARHEFALHVLLADATLRWARTRNVELYSGLAVGAATIGERETANGVAHSGRGSGFAFQLRLLGLALGIERVRVFAELGVGFESLVLGGVAVRL